MYNKLYYVHEVFYKALVSISLTNNCLHFDS